MDNLRKIDQAISAGLNMERQRYDSVEFVRVITPGPFRVMNYEGCLSLTEFINTWLLNICQSLIKRCSD
jgi:hypothetical protein